MKKYWNDDWLFAEVFSESQLYTQREELKMKPIRLPHTVIETPFNYFPETMYQMVSCYRKDFIAPADWQEKSVLISFEGVAHEAQVYINNRLCMTHLGGYTAFSIDLSDYLNYGGDNTLVVRVNSHESLNTPPFGYVIDYMTFGGIYRDVYLEVKSKVHIQDVFVYSEDILKPSRKMIVNTKVTDNCQNNLKVEYCLYDCSHNIVLSETHRMGRQEIALPAIQLWDIDTPNLYTLIVSLIETIDQDKTTCIDTQSIRIGFREAYFDQEGFKLNGKLLKIRGLNRHQSYPYVGYAMPARPQHLDAHIMKNELSLNAVRTSHYPQSQYFINACDELGLLVFTEMPGWQHIGDDSWKVCAINQVEEMVLQYRNHPSIILWGVRINESKDDDEFYQRTNQLAHSLDPSRQTGGVRCIKNSHLFEDVYTYNDFSFNGKTKGIDRKKDVTSNTHKSYLVTEYNGHMFPSKSFDNEAQRSEHALRHARVLDAIAGENEVAGGFGWCLFDYNTHQDFGSGDRICYHGVLDSFRNHKLAAAPYSSQGHDKVVLEVSSNFSIGDFPEGALGKIYAYSNAPEIKLYKNDIYVKTFYPNKETFPSLTHPPFIIDDLIGELLEKNEGFSHAKSEDIKSVLMAISSYGLSGIPLKYKLIALKLIMFKGMTFNRAEQLFYDYVGNWGKKATEYRFDALQNGKVVKSVVKKAMQEFRLEINVDTTQLKETCSYDVATIRLRATNGQGELLNYFADTVEIIPEGDIEVIGPHVVSMRGGLCGTYVKTIGKLGKGRITLKCRDTEEIIDFTIA